MKIILISMLFVYLLKFIIVIIILAGLEGGFPKILDMPSLKKQIAYGLPLGGSIMVGVTRKYIDQFIIAVFYNPVNFAIYSRGAFELPFIALLPYTLSTLMIPRIAEYQQEGKLSSTLYLWKESMRKVALVFFPLFIYTFFFAEEIITILFTKNYIESVLIFRIYLLLLPFRIVAYRTVLQAVGRTGQIFTAVNISLVISVAMAILLEKLIGFSGPAVGVVIGELVGSAYMLWQTTKSLKVSLSELIPSKQLFQSLSVSIAVGLLMVVFSKIELSSLMLLASSGFVYLFVYIILMKSLKFFTDNDWDLICRWATLRALRADK